VKRARTRLTRTGTVAVAATVVLAGAASAVYQVTGRRSAHANLPAGPRPAPATLRAAVSPASVTYGATVTVTGTVHDAAGQALAGRTVEVLTARTGATTAPSVVATPTTGADGRVSVPLRPDFGTSVWLR
jgi:protocatechuate 3,4-dioxygenase beta subunit